MAGTADDFLKLIEAIRTGGAPILSEEVVAEALRNQIGDLPRPGSAAIGRRFGLLGAVLDDPVAARSPQARGTQNWGGVYGHNWFFDPANGLSVVSMSNTAPEGSNGPYREEVRDAVYGA